MYVYQDIMKELKQIEDIVQRNNGFLMYLTAMMGAVMTPEQAEEYMKILERCIELADEQ